MNRRDFLGILGIGVAGTAVAASTVASRLQPEPENLAEEKPLRSKPIQTTFIDENPDMRYIPALYSGRLLTKYYSNFVDDAAAAMKENLDREILACL